MGRAAGDNPYYRVGIINQAGHPTGQNAYLYSVTTILGAIGKPLTWWGYKLGIEASKLVYYDEPSLLELPIDELYEKIKARKEITPFTVRDTAGGRGTSIHNVVEGFFIHDKLPDPSRVDESLHPYVKAFVRWTQDFLSEASEHDVVLCERPVYSLRYEYVGTCDLIIYKDGIYYVVDFKTSKALYADTLLQPIAYLNAAEEMSERARITGKGKPYLPPWPHTQPLVVALHDDETYEAASASDYDLEFEDFLTVYRQFMLKERLELIGDDLKSRRKEQLAATV